MCCIVLTALWQVEISGMCLMEENINLSKYEPEQPAFVAIFYISVYICNIMYSRWIYYDTIMNEYIK